MSEDNITTPGNEPHQLQAPGPGFDCAVIIEQVIEQTSAKHANTMATIANLMENQQQQMNKITCILAGISQFLVQGNLRQNNPNNGVPPSTSQQHYLGQNTPESVLLIDRNDNYDQGQQRNQTGYNTLSGLLLNTSQKPLVSGQTTQSRVLNTCTDTGGKRDETLSLVASYLFFQGTENEIQKDVHPRTAKEDDNHSSASSSTHEDQKYWLQFTELN